MFNIKILHKNGSVCFLKIWSFCPFRRLNSPKEQGSRDEIRGSRVRGQGSIFYSFRGEFSYFVLSDVKSRYLKLSQQNYKLHHQVVNILKEDKSETVQ